MAEGDSPTIARWSVRMAIREAREQVGLTQQQVAEAMEWSLSKVIRIENGDVSISTNDLRSVLALLGVEEPARVDALLADARTARTRARSVWWEQPPFRKYMSDGLRRFIGYEAEAARISSFAVLYIPGLLQTPEYSAALTGMWADIEMPRAKTRALVEARRKRLANLLRRAGSVDVFVVADESAFRRPVGGPSVFAGQLRRLIDFHQLGLLHVRMLPYDLEVPIANNGSFDLVTVSTTSRDSEVVYRENGMTDEFVENQALTAQHRKRFEQLWHAATDEADTIAFIERRIADLEADPS